MAFRTVRTATWALPLSVGCVLLSGCALGPLGPLASGDGAEYAELHSHNCSGLAIERQERLTRIATLEHSVQGELQAPPATLMQAVQRNGPSPEVGTQSYAQLAAERRLLDEVAAASLSAKCTVTATANAKTP